MTCMRRAGQWVPLWESKFDVFPPEGMSQGSEFLTVVFAWGGDFFVTGREQIVCKAHLSLGVRGAVFSPGFSVLGWCMWSIVWATI